MTSDEEATETGIISAEPPPEVTGIITGTEALTGAPATTGTTQPEVVTAENPEKAEEDHAEETGLEETTETTGEETEVTGETAEERDGVETGRGMETGVDIALVVVEVEQETVELATTEVAATTVGPREAVPVEEEVGAQVVPHDPNLLRSPALHPSFLEFAL